ncbi:CPBP family intramembrane metalloprotease [Paenibacillus antri]|uniref:CPBP family intramembrane metalloprotease n=1 Tax=Paenibacillus antri TaxID=2582848 RepID=A0A5R9GBC2_9BACL|nr:type II CAAX endopeptidase family protein [Paenibacillus antri]TLS51606.1 CPBP family intramembrane metalloprotease [Paenibacillus antri]
MNALASVRPYGKIAAASLVALGILFAFAGTYMAFGVMDEVLRDSWLLHLNNVAMGAAWVVAVAALLRRWERKSLTDLGMTLHRRDVGFLILCLFIALVVAVGFVWVLQGWSLRAVRSEAERFRELSYQALLVASVAGWFMAAFKEEVLARGFYLYQLRHLGAGAMVAVSSVFFMLLHVPAGEADVWKAASWFAGGVLYAYAYLKSGSLLVSTGMHAIHNFINELFLGQAEDFSIVTLSAPILGAEKFAYEAVVKGLLLIAVFLVYRGRPFAK